MFIKLLDNSFREIDWTELNQLKKDILWIYDENLNDIGNAFIPKYSFRLNYWEYLTLDGDNWSNENEKDFFTGGVLTILLCHCSEYINIAAGDQGVFDRQDLPIIQRYVQNYLPNNQKEKLIKEKLLLGLSISLSMTEDELKNTDFVHVDNEKYYKNINIIGNAIIKDYYESKIKEIKRHIDNQKD